jgi:hypothetical protein
LLPGWLLLSLSSLPGDNQKMFNLALPAPKIHFISSVRRLARVRDPQ